MVGIFVDGNVGAVHLVAVTDVGREAANLQPGEVRMASITSHIERCTRGLTGAGAETARPMTVETGNGREFGNGCIDDPTDKNK